MKILLLNGPNLNLLGTRETTIYGATSLGDIEARVRNKALAVGCEVEFFQSNHEGELIEKVQAASRQEIDVIIINPGGYTHTSVALRDALLAVGIPFIEVHLSRVAAREGFRQVNYFSDIASGTISGLGPLGYELALEAARTLYGKKAQ
ncbi:MAG TPA: type II 3-dehydroquinate dehydratase [Deltaproteobacteria bacterium]|nr:type II 3-dehydroquinate dehydratase [Deltaproteobacteria bacterium]